MDIAAAPPTEPSTPLDSFHDAEAPASQPSSDIQPLPSPTSTQSTRNPTLARRSKGKQRLAVEPSLSTIDFQMGSSATPLLTDSEVSRLSSYGIMPAPPTEGAAAARSRHNANEAKLTQHIADLNARITENALVCHHGRDDLLKLVTAVVDSQRSSSPPSPGHTSSSSPHALDTQLRALPSAVHDLSAQVISLSSLVQSHTARAERSPGEDRPRDSCSPSDDSTSDRDISKKRSHHRMSEGLPQRSHSGPAHKRAHLPTTSHDAPADQQRRSNSPYADVIFGPTGREGPLTNNGAREVAYACLQLVCPQRSPNAICNARPALGYPDHISNRFRSPSVADDFIDAINDNPPHDGQTAEPVKKSQRAKGYGKDQQHLLDIIRGSSSASRPSSARSKVAHKR
ncbi:hypothetical protein C0992_006638, partial [Termitomyces sp. T32_za158]